jgi:hypothetical protein
MARQWYDAILRVPSSWWTPINVSKTPGKGSTETCARGETFFLPALGGDQVATGAHFSSDPGEPMAQPPAAGGTFTPGWSDDGIIAIGTGNPGAGVRFADLDGKLDRMNSKRS